MTTNDYTQTEADICRRIYLEAGVEFDERTDLTAEVLGYRLGEALGLLRQQANIAKAIRRGFANLETTLRDLFTRF